MARPTAQEIMDLFNQAKTAQSPHVPQWRLNAAYCNPRQYRLWQAPHQPGLMNSSSMDATSRVVYDSTGTKSLPKYGAVLNKLVTPTGFVYHRVGTNNPQLNKIRAVKIFFFDLTRLLFEMRDTPRAGFRQSQGEVYKSIGVYGTGPKLLTWREAAPDDRKGGFHYQAQFIRDIFILVDAQGRPVGHIRWFSMNARQYKAMFGVDNAPKSVGLELGKSQPDENKYFWFLHCVMRRSDYDNKSLGVQRMLFTGNYICGDDVALIGEEEGFISDPYISARVETDTLDPYGVAPADYAFPALGGASAMKKTLIKAGHRAVSPPWLASDDGIMSGRIDIRPDRITHGGLDKQGQPRLKALETNSKFQVAEQLIVDERKDIEDCFLVNIFRILDEHPEMSAAEVYERVAKEGALVDPYVGRLQAEDQGPQIEREIALLAEHGKLPPVPGELIEAQGEYNINYTSPHARMQHADDIAGWFRLKEMAIAEATATSMPDALDWLDTDEAQPEIAGYMGVPPNWIGSPEQVAAKREARAERAQAEMMTKVAAPAASVAKAVMDKGINPRAAA